MAKTFVDPGKKETKKSSGSQTLTTKSSTSAANNPQSGIKQTRSTKPSSQSGIKAPQQGITLEQKQTKSVPNYYKKDFSEDQSVSGSSNRLYAQLSGANVDQAKLDEAQSQKEAPTNWFFATLDYLMAPLNAVKGGLTGLINPDTGNQDMGFDSSDNAWDRFSEGVKSGFSYNSQTNPDGGTYYGGDQLLSSIFTGSSDTSNWSTAGRFFASLPADIALDPLTYMLRPVGKTAMKLIKDPIKALKEPKSLLTKAKGGSSAVESSATSVSSLFEPDHFNDLVKDSKNYNTHTSRNSTVLSKSKDKQKNDEAIKHANQAASSNADNKPVEDVEQQSSKKPEAATTQSVEDSKKPEAATTQSVEDSKKQTQTTQNSQKTTSPEQEQSRQQKPLETESETAPKKDDVHGDNSALFKKYKNTKNKTVQKTRDEIVRMDSQQRESLAKALNYSKKDQKTLINGDSDAITKAAKDATNIVDLHTANLVDPEKNQTVEALKKILPDSWTKSLESISDLTSSTWAGKSYASFRTMINKIMPAKKDYKRVLDANSAETKQIKQHYHDIEKELKKVSKMLSEDRNNLSSISLKEISKTLDYSKDKTEKLMSRDPKAMNQLYMDMMPYFVFGNETSSLGDVLTGIANSVPINDRKFNARKGQLINRHNAPAMTMTKNQKDQLVKDLNTLLNPIDDSNFNLDDHISINEIGKKDDDKMYQIFKNGTDQKKLNQTNRFFKMFSDNTKGPWMEQRLNRYLDKSHGHMLNTINFLIKKQTEKLAQGGGLAQDLLDGNNNILSRAMSEALSKSNPKFDQTALQNQIKKVLGTKSFSNTLNSPNITKSKTLEKALQKNQEKITKSQNKMSDLKNQNKLNKDRFNKYQINRKDINKWTNDYIKQYNRHNSKIKDLNTQRDILKALQDNIAKDPELLRQKDQISQLDKSLPKTKKQAKDLLGSSTVQFSTDKTEQIRNNLNTLVKRSYPDIMKTMDKLGDSYKNAGNIQAKLLSSLGYSDDRIKRYLNVYNSFGDALKDASGNNLQKNFNRHILTDPAKESKIGKRVGGGQSPLLKKDPQDKSKQLLTGREYYGGSEEINRIMGPEIENMLRGDSKDVLLKQDPDLEKNPTKLSQEIDKMMEGQAYQLFKNNPFLSVSENMVNQTKTFRHSNPITTLIKTNQLKNPKDITRWDAHKYKPFSESKELQGFYEKMKISNPKQAEELKDELLRITGKSEATLDNDIQNLVFPKQIDSYLKSGNKVYDQDMRHFQQVSSSLLNGWKKWVLFNPGFLFRNFTGNIVQQIMGGMTLLDTLNSLYAGSATMKKFNKLNKKIIDAPWYKEGINSGKVGKDLDNHILQNLSREDQQTWKLQKEIENQHVKERSVLLDKENISKQANQLTQDPKYFKGTFSKGAKSGLNMVNKVLMSNLGANATMTDAQRIGSYLFARDGAEKNPLLNKIPTRTKKGKAFRDKMGYSTPIDALDYMMFNPQNLSRFERDVMTKIMPFYRFFRFSLHQNMSNVLQGDLKPFYNIQKDLVNNARESQDLSNQQISDSAINMNYIPIVRSESFDPQTGQMEPEVVDNVKWGYTPNTMSQFFDPDRSTIQTLGSQLSPGINALIESIYGEDSFTGQDESLGEIWQEAFMPKTTSRKSRQKSREKLDESETGKTVSNEIMSNFNSLFSTSDVQGTQTSRSYQEYLALKDLYNNAISDGGYVPNYWDQYSVPSVRKLSGTPDYF